jgi:hypothetical protein
MAGFDKDSGGLLNFSKAYHYIRQEIREAIDSIQDTFKVPTAQVTGVVDPGDNQQSISAFKDTSHFDELKPSSMHFISSPLEKEVVPVFQYDDSNFYGPPLPIYDSLVNTSQIEPKSTSDHSPNFTIPPTQVTPGDVVVQGRYSHALVLSDNYGKPTLRIANNFRSRGGDDMEELSKNDNVDLDKVQAADPTEPNFFDPNVDGSSIYFLPSVSPGLKLKEESVLNNDQRIINYVNEITQNVGGTFKQELIDVPNKMLITSDNIMIYTKGANHSNRNISMLSSGHLNLNSMKNIFITTPKVKDGNEGVIKIGNAKNRGTLPNAPMQPAVRGLNYLQTMIGLPDGEKVTTSSVLGMLKSLADAIEALADGGLSVDSNGQTISGDAVAQSITNTLKDDIESLRKKIQGELKGEAGKEIWTGDVSRKVFIE